MKTTDLKHISPSLPNEHESKNANNLPHIPNIEGSSANARFHDRTEFQYKNITRSDKIPGHNHSKEYILSEKHSNIPSFPITDKVIASHLKYSTPGGKDNINHSGIEYLNRTEKKITFQSKVPKSESTSKKMSANLSIDRSLIENNTSFGNSSNHSDKILPNTNHLSEQSLESPGFRHSYSHENNLNSNHLHINNQNQRVAVPDVEQKSYKEKLPIQTCRAVKTSKIDYRIREWRYHYGFSWGWTLEPIDPSHHSAIIPSHDSKNCSVSAKDIGHAKRKHHERNCSGEFSNVQSVLEMKDGQDSTRLQASAKEKTCINIPSISQHIKALPMNNIEHSLSVNDKCATSRDSQILNALQHSQLSVIKPSPSRNSIRKPVCDKRNLTIDESTMEYISSKKDRKPVYSGKKLTQDIQTLKATCINSLKKDIQDVNVDVNDTAKKVLMLEQYDPLKLKKMEEQSKDLSKYTNLIWKKFCKRDFGDKITNDFGQLWKDTYWRTYEAQENRLKTVTANIVNGIAKAPPERQIKLMDVNSHNPEKRLKKQKTEDPIKSESSGSDSSSPKYNSQRFSKDAKPVKRVVAPLMSKAKKMAAVSRRR